MAQNRLSWQEKTKAASIALGLFEWESDWEMDVFGRVIFKRDSASARVGQDTGISETSLSVVRLPQNRIATDGFMTSNRFEQKKELSLMRGSSCGTGRTSSESQFGIRLAFGAYL